MKNKRVYIAFESRSIGDTIVWIPYVSEFKTYFECEEVIVSTFHNWFFESEYKDLVFVEPGAIIKDIYAEYKIGCFDENRNLNKVDWRTRPLQQVVADILGIPFKEIKTRIKNFSSERQINKKYICMSEHSTAGCKYWLRENGWQSVVDYLIKEKDYKVVVISKEKTFLNNIIDKTNNTFEETIKTLKYCDFYIGVDSGPAWIVWAMGIPTIVISGFSKPFHEFVSNTERVINTYVCHGCFNDERYKFDRGDWYWCPLYKGTDRHFECSKKITVEMVIEAINRTTDKIK